MLPRGFVRIRHFGFFAHRRRAALLPLCFALLGQTSDPQAVTDSAPTDAPRPLWLCPRCGGAMAIVERFTAAEARFRSPPAATGTTMTCSFSSRNYASAGAPAGEDCSPIARSHRRLFAHSPKASPCPPGCVPSVLYPIHLPPPTTQFKTHNAVAAKPAHFKSLYRKRSGVQISRRSRSSSRRSVSDTALGLSRKLRNVRVHGRSWRCQISAS